MPWCEPCGRFYNPNTLTNDGRCPADHVVAEPADTPAVEHASGAVRATRPEEAPAAVDENAKVPWHFWLLLIALLLYLAWRLVQGVEWLL